MSNNKEERKNVDDGENAEHESQVDSRSDSDDAGHRRKSSKRKSRNRKSKSKRRRHDRDDDARHSRSSRKSRQRDRERHHDGYRRRDRSRSLSRDSERDQDHKRRRHRSRGRDRSLSSRNSSSRSPSRSRRNGDDRRSRNGRGGDSHARHQHRVRSRHYERSQSRSKSRSKSRGSDNSRRKPNERYSRRRRSYSRSLSRGRSRSKESDAEARRHRIRERQKERLHGRHRSSSRSRSQSVDGDKVSSRRSAGNDNFQDTAISTRDSKLVKSGGDQDVGDAAANMRSDVNNCGGNVDEEVDDYMSMAFVNEDEQRKLRRKRAKHMPLVNAISVAPTTSSSDVSGGAVAQNSMSKLFHTSTVPTISIPLPANDPPPPPPPSPPPILSGEQNYEESRPRIDSEANQIISEHVDVTSSALFESDIVDGNDKAIPAIPEGSSNTAATSSILTVTYPNNEDKPQFEDTNSATNITNSATTEMTAEEQMKAYEDYQQQYYQWYKQQQQEFYTQRRLQQQQRPNYTSQQQQPTYDQTNYQFLYPQTTYPYAATPQPQAYYMPNGMTMQPTTTTTVAPSGNTVNPAGAGGSVQQMDPVMRRYYGLSNDE